MQCAFAVAEVQKVTANLSQTCVFAVSEHLLQFCGCGIEFKFAVPSSDFKEQVVSSFLAADIPLHKLNHPSLKSLFATMGKVLPSETAARACVAKLASQKEEQIQELLRDKNFFLIVDEAEIAKQKYISVLVGSLDASNQTFLVDCHPLDSGSNVNSSIILHTMDDILRQLEIKRQNFSLFLTDAARCMSLVGKTLKELYPSLMHVTCVAHLLHNCAMRVRAHF